MNKRKSLNEFQIIELGGLQDTVRHFSDDPLIQGDFATGYKEAIEDAVRFIRTGSRYEKNRYYPHPLRN